MGQLLQKAIEHWKKDLLDYRKKNRLINFAPTKRSNILFIKPSFKDLFKKFVIDEKKLKFPFPKNGIINKNRTDFYEMNLFSFAIENENEDDSCKIIPGDIEADKEIGDLLKTLKNLRYRAKTSIEEQGINTLFLTFGMLKWKENDASNQEVHSPIILVPATLTQKTLFSQYELSPHEDESVVNPTLTHKLGSDFNISFPEFEYTKDDFDIEVYFSELENIIGKQGWEIEKDVNLTLLSFLKINMYRDLEQNVERLNNNPIVSVIVGEGDPIPFPNDLKENNYDHDKDDPVETYQVVDADSSQQDAILWSNRGVSFVLQGPPGTGKSQTITNIISEALSKGKKVLFVSEKKAALQVVYNRLKIVNLSDFCLSLHSHKANKKNVLDELEKAISKNRPNTQEGIIEDLQKLKKVRRELNNYSRDLHIPRSGLVRTIFQINGEIAKLCNIPEVNFEIPDVEKTTQYELEERCRLLSELSKSIIKQHENDLQNVWKNCKIEFLTFQLRQDIISDLTSLIPKIEDIYNYCEEYGKKIELPYNQSLEGFDKFIQIVSLSSESPIIPVKWIIEGKIEQLQSKAQQYNDCTNKIFELHSAISAQYEDSIFSINGQERKEHLLELKEKIDKKMRSDSLFKEIKQMEDTFLQINAISEVVLKIYNKSKEIANLMGVNKPDSFFKIKFLVSLSDALCVNVMPTDYWFDRERFTKIGYHIEAMQKAHDEVIMLKERVLLKFDKEIFEIEDPYSILKRFRSKYDSFFRFFNKNYRKDIKTLKQHLSIRTKLNYQEACDVLVQLKNISDKTLKINNQKNDCLSYFGSYYDGFDTSWEHIKKDIEKFQRIIDIFKTNEIPEKLKKLLITRELPYMELSEFYCKYSSYNIEEILETINRHVFNNYCEQTNCSNILQELDVLNMEGLNLIELFNDVLSKRKQPAQFDEIISELEFLSQMQTLQKNINEHEKEISENFEHYYAGMKSDWKKISEALFFAKRFKLLIENNNLPDEFVKKICCEKEFIENCKLIKCHFTTLQNEVNDSIKWMIGLFEQSEMLEKYSFKDLIEKLTKCKNNINLLQEWIDYRNNRRKCIENGLGNYISKVEEMSINDNHIVDAYFKRFYSLWLDIVIPQSPAIQEFRSKTHLQTIEEFKKLDKDQFKIAQARVRQQVYKNMPDFNSSTVATSEIGTLKKEFNKKSRRMPLRRLFQEIPHLLTTLKPCFMMSPLSVSVFLEANSYDFDLVIFDEASQVHPEDAIGAIMRGKQVIIVGDSHQLPPTDFFTNLLDDEEFDVDTEINKETAKFQSILDQAKTYLSNRSLLWHYRSRHEHLIAFSNIKIYEKSLITFPSSNDRNDNCGVEYIYVKNGIYDSGRKRNNIEEAKTVADLVFNHFDIFPKRSLGIVAFSVAQEEAINTAIHKKRIQNQDYEYFFKEEGEDEPFFVKNLENVQGDERDTIIFSIGYAKSQDGSMDMRFGPLNQDGGDRRLNVAITRAKYNVKLVGSIQPTDIDLNRTQAKGVKLLRSYIEFAQKGIDALKTDLVINDDPMIESPFEKSVYDFLVSKNYIVDTQIGCSGYRIDMAIKNGEKYVIGIECDGASYHSSRTARERDRLRQTILEDMGWTIYRIWSTDWIKDQKTEGENLIKAIKKAFNEPIKNKNTVEKDSFYVSSYDNLMEIEEDIEEKPLEKGYGFIPYQQVDLENFKHLTTLEKIRKVIEIEQPIHSEELYRKVAILFPSKKPTKHVKQYVMKSLKGHKDSPQSLKDDIDLKGPFISMKNFDQLQVRVPNKNESYIRSIEYISEDELGKAMTVIAEKNFGIYLDDLFKITAQEYGFKRTGDNIVDVLRKVYKKLLKGGMLKEVDGKVFL